MELKMSDEKQIQEIKQLMSEIINKSYKLSAKLEDQFVVYDFLFDLRKQLINKLDSVESEIEECKKRFDPKTGKEIFLPILWIEDDEYCYNEVS